VPSVILGVIALAKPVTTGKRAKVSGNRVGTCKPQRFSELRKNRPELASIAIACPETPCLRANPWRHAADAAAGAGGRRRAGLIGDAE
jgi:hypothetical protein